MIQTALRMEAEETMKGVFGKEEIQQVEDVIQMIEVLKINHITK
jgi:hypothetical protein